jgi:hypothetical protein
MTAASPMARAGALHLPGTGLRIEPSGDATWEVQTDDTGADLVVRDTPTDPALQVHAFFEPDTTCAKELKDIAKDPSYKWGPPVQKPEYLPESDYWYPAVLTGKMENGFQALACASFGSSTLVAKIEIEASAIKGSDAIDLSDLLDALANPIARMVATQSGLTIDVPFPLWDQSQDKLPGPLSKLFKSSKYDVLADTSDSLVAVFQQGSETDCGAALDDWAAAHSDGKLAQAGEDDYFLGDWSSSFYRAPSYVVACHDTTSGPATMTLAFADGGPLAASAYSSFSDLLDLVSESLPGGGSEAGAGMTLPVSGVSVQLPEGWSATKLPGDDKTPDADVLSDSIGGVDVIVAEIDGTDCKTFDAKPGKDNHLDKSGSYSFPSGWEKTVVVSNDGESVLLCGDTSAGVATAILGRSDGGKIESADADDAYDALDQLALGFALPGAGSDAYGSEDDSSSDDTSHDSPHDSEDDDDHSDTGGTPTHAQADSDRLMGITLTAIGAPTLLVGAIGALVASSTTGKIVLGVIGAGGLGMTIGGVYLIGKAGREDEQADDASLPAGWHGTALIGRDGHIGAFASFTAHF